MLECPEDAWDKIFEINVKVSFLLFKECVPHMKVKVLWISIFGHILNFWHLQRRGGGSAIFISSFGGYNAISALGPYSVSKSALIGLTKALSSETASDNIRVNCVAPGVVRSPAQFETGSWVLHKSSYLPSSAGPSLLPPWLRMMT